MVMLVGLEEDMGLSDNYLIVQIFNLLNKTKANQDKV